MNGWDDPVAVGTLALAGVTLLLALATFRMAGAAKKEAKATATLAETAQQELDAIREQVLLGREQIALSREQTAETVAEMRRARGAQSFPKLVPTLFPRAPGFAFLRIVNVGPGPALNVDVYLWLEPGGERRRWKSSVVAPGESHDFIPHVSDDQAEVARLDQLTERFVTMHLQGSCTDVSGDPHRVAEQVDIRETWELVKSADELAPTDLMRDIATELKKVREEVAKIRGR